MTFQDAAAKVADWIAAELGHRVTPALLAPGVAGKGDGVGYHPWRLDSPRTRHSAGGPIGVGTGRFAVWTWAEDPLVACSRLDTLFFAAIADPHWKLSETEPPDSFWSAGPHLALTLACEVSHPLAKPAAGKVLEPLVFDIVTTRDHAARQRT